MPTSMSNWVQVQLLSSFCVSNFYPFKILCHIHIICRFCNMIVNHTLCCLCLYCIKSIAKQILLVFIEIRVTTRFYHFILCMHLDAPGKLTYKLAVSMFFNTLIITILFLFVTPVVVLACTHVCAV